MSDTIAVHIDGSPQPVCRRAAARPRGPHAAPGTR
jgi:hypothetical protein